MATKDVVQGGAGGGSATRHWAEAPQLGSNASASAAAWRPAWTWASGGGAKAVRAGRRWQRRALIQSVVAAKTV
jgi:hypothetical protein